MLVVCIVYFDDIRGIAYQSLDGPATQPTHSKTSPSKTSPHTTSVDRVAYTPTVTLKADRQGHFETAAYINNTSIDVLVDTGATLVVLNYEDARKAGIFVNASDFTGTSQTANGRASFAPITIDELSIGDITIYDVQAAISSPDRDHPTLLGMSFLRKLASFEVRSGVLLMEQ